MRGHVRQRGSSWEYIADIGMAPRQRCQSCSYKGWVERRPLEACPTCGGDLTEKDERRRAIKGGFATQSECETALTKVLSAVDESRFVPPNNLTVREFLLKVWLPAIKATVRPNTYSSYKMLAEQHIVPTLGSTKLQKLHPAQINALYARKLEKKWGCPVLTDRFLRLLGPE